MTRAAVVLALLAGCPSKSDAPRPEAQPVQAAWDAGTGAITPISAVDPRSEMHPDDDVSGRVVAQTQTRAGRAVDITLRSSPSGARVAVDGVPKGLTPGYWEGTTGAEHEFTFVLEGYAMARYRFVPIASGVVHARLEPIAEESTDAGVSATSVSPGLPPTVPPLVPTAPSIDAGVGPVATDAAIIVAPAPDAAFAGSGSPGVGPQP